MTHAHDLRDGELWCPAFVRRLVLGSALAVVGLTVSEAAGGTGGKLDGAGWTLETYDASGVATAVPASVTADARFTGNRIAGFGGCNAFSGDAAVSGSSLKLGPVAATRKACDGEPATVESAYFANLGRAASYTATADRLTIFDAAGRPILVYRAGRANPVAGTWRVTGINNGKQAVVSPQIGTTVTATFTPDGHVSGSGGCNAYTGTYVVSGQDLRIGSLASTRIACEQTIMDQEAQFFTALGHVTAFDTSGPTVMLRDASGAMQVVLTGQ